MVPPKNSTGHLSYTNHWFGVFERRGLRRVWRIRDTTAPREFWSKILYHSAWARDGLLGRPTCEQFGRAQEYGKKVLSCN